jgi:dsDNA-specific endonuclease/ATPase MutS2
MRLKIDLHDIFSNGRAIDGALHDIMNEAIDKRAERVEIIPGKGSGQLKKSVLRFLEKNYKGRFSRIEKDDRNFGRIFVHFNWNKLST